MLLAPAEFPDERKAGHEGVVGPAAKAARSVLTGCGVVCFLVRCCLRLRQREAEEQEDKNEQVGCRVRCDVHSDASFRILRVELWLLQPSIEGGQPELADCPQYTMRI